MPSASDTSFSYRAYGCNLVCDMRLSRLMPGWDGALDTITLRREDTLPEPPEDAVNLGCYCHGARGFLSLDIRDVAHLVALNGDTLLYRPYGGIDEASLQLFLLGSGLGAVLMQRELLVMHGNAFEVAGEAVMCVGPSGVGKSTTAAAMMQRGHRVLSDDVCAINGDGQIVPGMPHIKLWEAAAAQLHLSTDGLETVRPQDAKYNVPLGAAFYADPLPLRRVYVLQPDACAAVGLEPVSAAEKFMVLRDNTYRLPFVSVMSLGAAHFQQLAALSARVSVTRIRRPEEGFHLDSLLEGLIADAKRGSPEV